jgi:hypothetical protein
VDDVPAIPVEREELDGGDLLEEGALASDDGPEADGYPSETDDAVEPPAPAAARSEPPAPTGIPETDAEGVAIPVHAAWAWKRDYPRLMKAGQAAAACERILREVIADTLAGGPNGPFAREMAALALKLADALEQSEPRVCPACTDETRSCFVCGDHGWIHKSKYDAFNATDAEVRS